MYYRCICSLGDSWQMRLMTLERGASLLLSSPKTSISLGAKKSYVSTWMHHEHDTRAHSPCMYEHSYFEHVFENVIQRIRVLCTCRKKHLIPRVSVTIPARVDHESKRGVDVASVPIL